MRYLLLPYIILSFSLCAQQKKIDSLTTLLSKSTDTTKVNVLAELAWQLTYSEPERAKTFASQAVTLAEQLGYSKGLINVSVIPSQIGLTGSGKVFGVFGKEIYSGSMTFQPNWAEKTVKACYTGICVSI